MPFDLNTFSERQKGISYLMWQSHREDSKLNKAVWSLCHFSLPIASVYALQIQSFFFLLSNDDDVTGRYCCGCWNRQLTSFRGCLQSMFLALDIVRTVILQHLDTMLTLIRLLFKYASLARHDHCVQYNLTTSIDISSDLVSCRVPSST